MTTLNKHNVQQSKIDVMIKEIFGVNSFLGFSSVKEAIVTSLGLRTPAMVTFESFFTMVGVILAFVDMYVFHPKEQYFVLILFLIGDYITGVAVGIKVRKEGFSTRKGQRIIFLFLSYTFAMLGSHWLAKVGEAYFFMPYLVFYYLTSVLVLSSFKNLAMLGLLPKNITSVLNKYVDAHKDQVIDIIREANEASKKKGESNETE